MGLEKFFSSGEKKAIHIAPLVIAKRRGIALKIKVKQHTYKVVLCNYICCSNGKKLKMRELDHFGYLSKVSGRMRKFPGDT